MITQLHIILLNSIATSTVKEDSTQESDNDENDVIHPSTVRPAVEVACWPYSQCITIHSMYIGCTP